MHNKREMERNTKGSNPILVLLVFASMAAHESNGSPLATIRKPLQDNNNPSKITRILSQNSPSPAPGPASEGVSIRSCKRSLLKTCGDKNNINIKACLISSSHELFLLVQNDGESNVQVNVTTRTTSLTKQIPKGDTKKFNVSDGGISTITLNINNETCIIRFESRIPDNFMGSKISVSWVYILLVGALVFGGTWACCVLRKKGHQVDGVPYQQLELGRSESPSGVVEETTDQWDRGWDDQWGEGEATEIGYPYGRQNGNESSDNGLQNFQVIG